MLVLVLLLLLLLALGGESSKSTSKSKGKMRFSRIDWNGAGGHAGEFTKQNTTDERTASFPSLFHRSAHRLSAQIGQQVPQFFRAQKGFIVFGHERFLLKNNRA